jgi:hypothetical protein
MTIEAAILGLLLTQAAQPPPPDATAVDPLTAFSGAWQIVDTDSGKVALSCAEGQTFAVAADRRSIALSDTPSGRQFARYIVLDSGPDRILAFIEGEMRRTEAGDPIVWYAYFEGPDRFRWRQYHWPAEARTAAQWRRCPAG